MRAYAAQTKHNAGSRAGSATKAQPAWLDAWTIILLVYPIYGSFYPLESYLSLGAGEGLTGFARLPIPVTTLTLVAVTVSIGYYFALASRIGKIRQEYLGYIFISIALLSFAWSTDPDLTLIRAIRYIPYIFLGIILPQIYTTQKLLRLMVISFLIAAILSIFMGVAVPALGNSRLGGGYENAWRGALVHKNLTGIVFAVGVLICWMALTQNAASKALAGVTALLCLVMLVRSQSGTALAGLLISGAIGAMLVVTQRSPVRIRLIVFTGSVLLGLAGVFAGLMIVDAIFSASGRDMTFTGRTPIWAAVWTLIQAHPIRGYGYAFWAAQGPDARWVSQVNNAMIPHSHNSWLDLWLQLGIGGLICVALITLIGLGTSLKLTLLSQHRLGPPLFALQFLLLFRSMTEVQYTDPFISLLFFPIWTLVTGRIALREAAAGKLFRPRRNVSTMANRSRDRFRRTDALSSSQ